MGVDVPRGPGRGRWPGGFLGMLLLVVLIERSLAGRALDFTRPEYWDWRTAGHAAKKIAPGCGLLCFGTSMTQQGLLPCVLKDHSGRRARNLAVCAGQAPGSYFLLRRALEAGAKPAAVLVEFHPQYLAEGHWGAVRFWPDLLDARDGLDLAWATRDAEFFATTALARQLPSVKDRFQIRDCIRAAVRGESASTASATLIFNRNRNRNEGALVMPRNPGFRGEIAPHFRAGFLPDSWHCHPTNAAYVRRFLDLAAAHHITVYWVIPPLSPNLQSAREQKGLDAAFTRFTRSFQAHSPNLVVLDARHSGYALDVFTDAAHLDGRGACTLSADVGDLLRVDAGKDEPESARWIDLPAYRDRPPVAPPEDLAASRVAVEALAAAKVAR